MTAMSRRNVLRAAALARGAGALAACSSKLKGAGDSGSSDVLKIGYVSPQTGVLASFAASDNFVIDQVRTALKSGFTVAGKKRSIEVVVKDSQSSSTRAAEVTRDLIFTDKVDIVLASATPDTANPVADTCEANAMPNVSTIVPWEAWFFGRGKKPGESFKYTTMFFFGMDEFTNLFIHMWDRMNLTDKNVACLWPNDTDANAFRSGFTPVMPKHGYKVVDSGGYQDLITDFSAQISKFKSNQCDLFTCTPLPPDFQTFWKQAAQQGYKPKLATVAKVMLFPTRPRASASCPTTSPPTRGGARRIRTSRRSTARRASSSPTTSPPPPASSGARRWAACTRCSRSPCRRSSRRATRRTTTTWPTSSRT